MKNILLSIAVIASFAIVSCKTSKDVTPVTGNSTNNIKVPTGFNWQNSRNVSFTVNITDTRFQTDLFMVAIYDGNPAAGGNLLAKGSASVSAAFKSKVYLSNQITQVYVVKTSPANSKTTQQVQVSTVNVTTSIGI